MLNKLFKVGRVIKSKASIKVHKISEKKHGKSIRMSYSMEREESFLME
jgi:hypothetical protein